MPKISIIIPVYNVEPFLGKCLDHIVAQTFQDYEVLLVNDGSTDNSQLICREYAQKDRRFTVINKKNGGLSSARNAGLDAAKGEYIGFVDSDDYIASDMYELLYKNIIKYDADISICSFYVVFADGHISHNKNSNICRYMNNEEAVKTLLTAEHFENFVWDKLYKRGLFDNIRFPENELFEDIAVMYKLLDCSKTVIYESKPKYYYVQRPGSILNSGFSIKKMQFIEQYKKIISFSKGRGGIYDRESRALYARGSLWLIYEAGIYGKEYSGILNKLKENVLNNYDVSIKSPILRTSDKIVIYLLKRGISINLICRVHLIVKNLTVYFKGCIYKIRNLYIKNIKVENV